MVKTDNKEEIRQGIEKYLKTNVVESEAVERVLSEKGSIYNSVKKNEYIAAILSVFISGLGQIYNGNYLRGVLLFAFTWFLFFTVILIPFSVLLYCIYNI